jgi:hypothetical protein
VLTVIGGLLLAYAGHVLQSTLSTGQQQIAWHHQLQEKKYALLSEFTVQFNKEATQLQNILYLDSWLAKNSHRKETAMYQGGRASYSDVEAEYDDLSKKYMDGQKSVSLLLSINALFDHDVAVKADALIQELDALVEGEALDDSAIKKRFVTLHEHMQELARAMGGEIKRGASAY